MLEAFSSLTSFDQHAEELEQERRQQVEVLTLNRELHRQRMRESEARHRGGQNLLLNQHHVEKEHKTEIARRDAARDVVLQKTLTTQSSMMVNAFMIENTFRIIYQMQTPDDVSEPTIVLISIFLSLSLTVLLISVGLALRLQRALTEFRTNAPLHRYRPCGRVHETFEAYFRCHCAWLEWWAIRLLDAGFALSLAAAGVYQFSIYAQKDFDKYVTWPGKDNKTAVKDTHAVGPGCVFAACCGISIVLVLVWRFFLLDQTRPDNELRTGLDVIRKMRAKASERILNVGKEEDED